MKKRLIITVMLLNVLALGYSQSTLSGTYRYSANADITFIGDTFIGSWNATSPISGTYTVSGSRLTLNITGGPKSPTTWIWTIVNANTLKDHDGDSWGLVSVRPQSSAVPSTTTAPSINSPEALKEKDYILPYSSTRELTDSDLRNLTKDELRLARNEIYARYGRVFRDEALQKYFDSKSWYKNLRKLPLGTEPVLTKLERSNIELIQVYEAR